MLFRISIPMPSLPFRQRPVWAAVSAFCLAAALSPLLAQPLSHRVNPFVGTDFTGNTYPGAQVPFGMVQLSPDNGLPGWDRIAGYFYPDSTIAGFSHTHLSGTGAGDLYDISYLPATLPLCQAPEPLGTHSRFSHSEEEAHAGYYRVRLADYGIGVELTATPRCGVQRYTFPRDGRERVVRLDLAKAMNWDRTLGSEVRMADSCTLEGFRASDGWARGQRVWFRTRFSAPIRSLCVDTVFLPGGAYACTAQLGFGADCPDTLTLVTALSPTGYEGARMNLGAEGNHNDFDRYRHEAEAAWDSLLACVRVEGGPSERQRTFYTALYRACLAPTLFDDADGAYPGPDGKLHRASGGRHNYGTFSLWDTYRAAHPLYALLFPARAADMASSLMDFAEQNGRLPVWNMWGAETDMMIGYHAASVLCEAVLKGLPGIDAHRALALCRGTAELDGYRGIGMYRRMGYVPYDVAEPTLNDDWALSRTLEYCYDDACIARLARHVGDRRTARTFARRARSYRRVYNPLTGFMQPRDSAGRFQPDFRPEEYTPHICESNAWHYLWNVQHDLRGLRRLMGKRLFAERLDSLFSPRTADSAADRPIFSTGMIGQYAHGNEPSHHVAYLFNLAGQPEKTQWRVYQIMTQLYDDTPSGLCGNEDCGQMSAWYVFSALGFYPVDPTSCRYEIGTPLFPRATLRLPGGKTFVVEAKGYAPDRWRVKRVTLNGRRLRRTYITHEELVRGGTLVFEMAS